MKIVGTVKEVREQGKRVEETRTKRRFRANDGISS